MAVNKVEMAIQDAVEACVNTRQLCGNESNAIRMVEDDYGMAFTTSQVYEIQKRTNRVWNHIQKAAGVPAHKRGNGRPYDKPIREDDV